MVLQFRAFVFFTSEEALSPGVHFPADTRYEQDTIMHTEAAKSQRTAEEHGQGRIPATTGVLPLVC